MVRRQFSMNPDEDYYRLAENIYNNRRQYIGNKEAFRREYADYLKNKNIRHPVRSMKVLEKVWEDYKTMAQTEILEKIQKGETVTVKKRHRKKTLGVFDTKGRIKLREFR